MTNLTEALSRLRKEREQYFEVKAYLASEFPDTMKALRMVDLDYTAPKRRKGFNLVKRENRKLGYVYYVRYSHGGKMLPSKWNTGTNVLEEAERFAAEHRERLVAEYMGSHDTKAYDLLEKFYGEGSEYLACEEKRNRPLSPRRRKNYYSVMTQKFIPFLKEKKVAGFEKITIQTLSDFQDRLLAGGIKPQTVNDNLKAVKKVFVYLARKGLVKENPCDMLHGIPVHHEDQEVRGCYELGRLRGVFNERWEDRLSYMLCLLIYTTGMRNCEIGRIRKSDIIETEGCHFIDIKESKTANGVRLVPLHEKVYGELTEYASGKGLEEYVFGEAGQRDYQGASRELDRRLKAEEAERQHITFYSGRHYWKTLMSSGGLGGDAEELFMGHKVSGDVAKRYNHRDKQGERHMVKKAKQVFGILNNRLFTESATERVTGKQAREVAQQSTGAGVSGEQPLTN
ncbi:MAG: tyrosine-type recombinase/integrase [Spirochaetaceae bacterium]|jgi:integrase|nr:tyrosine-type recombinase/integrase [Spirochaetaceae bacterium]